MDVSLAGFSRGAAPSPSHATPATPAAPAPAAQVSADPIEPRSVLAIVSDILAIPLPENSATPTALVSSPSPAMAQAVAQASGSSGVACDIDGAVQTALRTDPDAHGAVLLVAPRNRSAANAVMLWNGHWIAPAEAGRAGAYDGLRASIRGIVAGASPECRGRSILGPRFMLIPAFDTTMVVVFGNASWRWADLLGDRAGPPSESPKMN